MVWRGIILCTLCILLFVAPFARGQLIESPSGEATASAQGNTYQIQNLLNQIYTRIADVKDKVLLRKPATQTKHTSTTSHHHHTSSHTKTQAHHARPAATSTSHQATKLTPSHQQHKPHHTAPAHAPAPISKASSTGLANTGSSTSAIVPRPAHAPKHPHRPHRPRTPASAPRAIVPRPAHAPKHPHRPHRPRTPASAPHAKITKISPASRMPLPAKKPAMPPRTNTTHHVIGIPARAPSKAPHPKQVHHSKAPLAHGPAMKPMPAPKVPPPRPPPPPRHPPPRPPSPPPPRPPPPPPPSPPPPANPPPPPPPPSPPAPAPPRSQMCQARNLRSMSAVGGKRIGPRYFEPCLHTINAPIDCCTMCQSNDACTGWFSNTLDCSARGGETEASVCYMIADTVLAWEEEQDSQVTAGTIWSKTQDSQWNIGYWGQRGGGYP